MTAPRTGRAEVTPLPPEKEQAFRAWLQRNRVTDLDLPDSFYDYRGAFLSGLNRDGATAHWPDTFKQHGHPTFSIESQYSAGPGDGGRWNGDTFIPPESAMPAKKKTPVPTSGDISTAPRTNDLHAKLTQDAASIASLEKELAAWQARGGKLSPGDDFRELGVQMPGGLYGGEFGDEEMRGFQQAAARLAEMKAQHAAALKASGFTAAALRGVSAPRDATDSAIDHELSDFDSLLASRRQKRSGQ